MLAAVSGRSDAGPLVPRCFLPREIYTSGGGSLVAPINAPHLLLINSPKGRLLTTRLLREVMSCCELDVVVDGLLAYDVRQGDRRGTDLDFFDYTYDGAVVAGGSRLVGGLGQLTDGDEGSDNFRQHDGGGGRRGYEWVGWKSGEFAGDDEYVEIAFQFDEDRNFTSVTFHVNNAFNRDVRIFRAATFLFERRRLTAVTTSLPVPVEFEYERDNVMEYARHVIVPLQHGVGQRIVARLYFDARWIMISEVQFQSGE